REVRHGEVAAAETGDIALVMAKRLRQECGDVVERFRLRLTLGRQAGAGEEDWLRDWLKASFPATWFWTMQEGFRDYFRQPPEDKLKQWQERLRKVYQTLRQRHDEGESDKDLDEWLTKSYVLESAILLARLGELPFEPGRHRRGRLHNAYA